MLSMSRIYHTHSLFRLPLPLPKYLKHSYLYTAPCGTRWDVDGVITRARRGGYVGGRGEVDVGGLVCARGEVGDGRLVATVTPDVQVGISVRRLETEEKRPGG